MARKNEMDKVYIVRINGYYFGYGSNEAQRTTKILAYNNKETAWKKFRNECFLEWNRITQEEVNFETENKGKFLLEHPWDETWLDDCKTKFFDDNEEDFTTWMLGNESKVTPVEWTYKERCFSATIQLLVLKVFSCVTND